LRVPNPPRGKQGLKKKTNKNNYYPGKRPQTMWGSERIMYDNVDADGDDDDDDDDDDDGKEVV
jgi:hypothetical protein